MNDDNVDMPDVDLIVIGSGPAGMSAAVKAAQAGAGVTLIDEQPAAGGQIFRSITSTNDQLTTLLGAEYVAGRVQADALSHPSIRAINDATVWRVDADGAVCFSVNCRGEGLRGRQVIVATGALERPVPYPGWTTPGVMTAGAAQILLKSAGICTDNAVLVGSGPLLYLLAQQLVKAGYPPLALIETQPDTQAATFKHSTQHLAGALKGWRYLARGLQMLVELRRAGVKRYVGARQITFDGDESIEAVSFIHRGVRKRIACRHAFVHQGVVPNTQITRSLGIEHRWDECQACFWPVTDSLGRTSIPAVLVAGDGGGIIGANASAISGELAALAALAALGKISDRQLQDQARPLRKRLQQETAVRPLLDALYAPPADVFTPDDDTIVCRCEDITAGDIRGYAKLGCVGPNQTKAFGRPGMGPCQGRYCGLTVTNLLAQANSMSQQEVGYYRIRAPLKPITVGELADLHADGNAAVNPRKPDPGSWVR